LNITFSFKHGERIINKFLEFNILEVFYVFGIYDIPLRMEREFTLSVEERGENFVYRRESGDEIVEKMLLAGDGKLLVNPVEPLNKPKEITPLLLIEFQKPVVIEPGAKRKIFLKFPIEIGVFISGGKKLDVLDIFTIARQKYTLYGDVSTGKICRYWKSDVYPSIPEADPVREGILELRFENLSRGWVEVTRAVFNAYGMKIYYSDSMVSMRGNMRILGEGTAETYFSNSPLEKGMKKAVELYTARRLAISTKFLMEAGL
jgi:hypothetical protein